MTTTATVESRYGKTLDFSAYKDGYILVNPSGAAKALMRPGDIRAALDKIDPPNTTNQERNREALIEHIAEQDRIIRRRNEQIGGLVERIEEAEGELAGYRAMHSEQIKTITRLQENPRPLTADDITEEMVERVHSEWQRRSCVGAPGVRFLGLVLRGALTEPTRPEEKVEGVLRRYWSGDINGDDLADRIVEEMNR